jgi:hypothetical protein
LVKTKGEAALVNKARWSERLTLPFEFNYRLTLLFCFPTFKLCLFDKPLCLSERARGLFPEDIDKLN